MTVAERLEAVQNAAIERALADDEAVRRHLETVGALEVARGEATGGAADGSGIEGTPSDGTPFDETFATAMCCLAVAAALPPRRRPSGPVSPPTPGGRRDRDDLLALGADLAVERYGADRERLARLAGVPPAALE